MKSVKVYFYHTQDTVRIVREWKEGRFPSHFLYGALQLPKHGMEVIWHDQIHKYKRVQDTLRATWKILTCREHYDVLYATHTRGIEPIILLHALGLYRRPIVVWHHQPIVTAKSRLRESLARLFYRGMDHMFFFSEKLIADSLRSEKADPTRMSMAHWGADMDFYKTLLSSLGRKMEYAAAQSSLHPGETGEGRGELPFISTGKEMRDYETLISAFNATDEELTLFVEEKRRAYFESLTKGSNIHLHYGNRPIPYEISLLVARSRCVCICCQRSNYTVGLTTVVEALALGLPILCTRNPQMPMDLEKEGCGIYIEPGDTAGWERAIRYIACHSAEAQEMGRRGRALAEKYYNDEQCGCEVAEVLKAQSSGASK